MNTQIENSNNGNADGNNELDGGTVKHWLRETRIDRVLGTGNRRTRKARGSSRPHNMTTKVVRSTVETSATKVTTRSAEKGKSGDFPYIPEGCKPEDVIPGTGGWTWGEALEASLEARSRRSRR